MIGLSSSQQKEERLLFFPGNEPVSEKPWTLCSLQPSWIPFPPYKSVLFLLPCGNLHIAHHGCRPRIAILCWFQINPSLLECICFCVFFQVNRFNHFRSIWKLSMIWEKFLTYCNFLAHTLSVDSSFLPVCLQSLCHLHIVIIGSHSHTCKTYESLSFPSLPQFCLLCMYACSAHMQAHTHTHTLSFSS